MWWLVLLFFCCTTSCMDTKKEAEKKELQNDLEAYKRREEAWHKALQSFVNGGTQKKEK